MPNFWINFFMNRLEFCLVSTKQSKKMRKGKVAIIHKRIHVSYWFRYFITININSVEFLLVYGFARWYILTKFDYRHGAFIKELFDYLTTRDFSFKYLIKASQFHLYSLYEFAEDMFYFCRVWILTKEMLER